MVDWRLLFFIIFGIFQPIISEGLVEGKDCCVQFPQSLQHKTRFSNGPDRFTDKPGERRVRNFDTDRYQWSTRLESSQNRDSRNLFQHSERIYDNKRRITEIREQTRETGRAIERIDNRRVVFKRTSRKLNSESQRSSDRLNYVTRNNFAERLYNVQDSDLSRNRYTRNGHKSGTTFKVQRLNKERHINELVDTRNVYERQIEDQNHQFVRSERLLSNSRDFDRSEHAKSRSEQYRRNTAATSRLERNERVLAYMENNYNRDDDRRITRVREHYSERSNENRGVQTRGDRRNASRDFTSVTRRFNINDYNSKMVIRESNQNRDELSRIRNRVIESRNRVTGIYVERSTETLLDRTTRFEDRSTKTIRHEENRSFGIARDRDQSRMHIKPNIENDVRNRNTQVKSEIEVNRNIQNRGVLRVNRQNKRIKERDVRDKSRRSLDEETEKSELNYRRPTDASNNRAMAVLRSNIRREMRSNRMAPPGSFTRETRDNVASGELRSFRRIQERRELRQINKQESAFERVYSSLPIENKNGNRRVNIERQSRTYDYAIEILNSDNGFELKLHHLFYIIQGIYILSFFMNIPSKDKDFSKKERMNSWLSTRMALKMD